MNGISLPLTARTSRRPQVNRWSLGGSSDVRHPPGLPRTRADLRPALTHTRPAPCRGPGCSLPDGPPSVRTEPHYSRKESKYRSIGLLIRRSLVRILPGAPVSTSTYSRTTMSWSADLSAMTATPTATATLPTTPPPLPARGRQTVRRRSRWPLPAAWPAARTGGRLSAYGIVRGGLAHVGRQVSAGRRLGLCEGSGLEY